MNIKILLCISLSCLAVAVSAADGTTSSGIGAGIFMLACAIFYIMLGILKKNRALQKSLGDSIEKTAALEKTIQESVTEKEELQKKIVELQKHIEKYEKTISGLRETLKSDSFDGRFPICAKCKDLRDEKGFWHPIEEYLQNLSPADFSHSLCPNCAKELYPDLFKDGNKPHTLTWK